MSKLYPMFFTPVFKDYLWGGRNLAKFGRDLPASGVVAESWEIAAHPDGMTRVANGAYAGQTLQEVLERLGNVLIGTKNAWALEQGKFPWLVKLLDAERDLSVQVHPDDAFAQQHEGNELGKTEMWVVLKADPDAAIIYGLSQQVTREAFREAIQSRVLSQYLNRVPISAGDHICVPAGTLHAILAGSVIAEIQQNSNTTYRVYDWDRVGEDGRPRPLHVENALDVINFHQVGLGIPEPQVISEQGGVRRELLCQNHVFTTERFTMPAGTRFTGTCSGESMEIWGILRGRAAIAGESIADVRFVLLPAELGGFSVVADSASVLVRTYAS